MYYVMKNYKNMRAAGPFETRQDAYDHMESYPNPSALHVSTAREFTNCSDFAEVGETIQFTNGKGVQEGEVMFVHRDLPTGDPLRNADYYSIATGPNPMDRHYLNSNMMKMMKVVNLSAGQQLSMEF